MNIVVAKRLQEQLTAADTSVRQSFAKAVATLGVLSKDRRDSSVSKLEGTDPDLYVLRVGSVRYIFAYQEDDIVLLGLTTGKSHGGFELRYVDRFRLMPKSVQQSEVDAKIADTNYQLIDREEVAGEMALTNAFGWYVDDYHVERIDVSEDEIRVAITWHASGDQDEDRTYHGHEMKGQATAVIDQDGGVAYEEVSAALVDSNDGHPEGDI